MSTDMNDTTVNVTVVDGQVYLSAADLAAKFAHVAQALEDLGPEMCLARGNDSATLFAGWTQMLTDLANTNEDHDLVSDVDPECGPCVSDHPDEGCSEADCHHNCQAHIERNDNDD